MLADVMVSSLTGLEPGYAMLYFRLKQAWASCLRHGHPNHWSHWELHHAALRAMSATGKHAAYDLAAHGVKLVTGLPNTEPAVVATTTIPQPYGNGAIRPFMVVTGAMPSAHRACTTSN
jgi:hypothetical protein